MAAATIEVLGHVCVRNGGVAMPLGLLPKSVELLGYLTAHQVPVSRDVLAAALWPDADEEDGRTKLRRHLHRLTHALPPCDVPYVLTPGTTLQWNPGCDVVVDVIAFRRALRERDDRAADLYGGDFLEGFYADWVLAERESLRAAFLSALYDRLRRKRGENDLRGALDDVRRLRAADPWREDLVRIEMTLRDRLGDRSGAVASFRSFATALVRELETEPMPETRALFETLTRGDDLPLESMEPAKPRVLEERKSLPLRGRDDELAALEEAWSAAARGRGSLALVAGEAGIGKSRLAHELALRAESQGGRVVIGTTSPREIHPHEAVVEALRASLAFAGKALHDAALLGALLPLLPELEARYSLVAPPAADDAAARIRLFDAVATAFAAVARSRPLLVILEDLHAAGTSTFDLLEFLVRRGERSPMLIVATFRDEETRGSHPLRRMRKRLEAESLARAVALERLDAQTAAALVRASLAADASEETVARIVAAGEGLPLFLNEAVRDPSRASDAERLNISRRIAALPPDARTILEIAAVAGPGFDVDLLAEASGWTEAAVTRALGPIVASRIVREPYRGTRSDYVFSHQLIAAAVYEGIGEAERRRRHARIADALAVLGGGAAADRAAEIAEHLTRGGRAPEAAAWFATAAKRAATMWATDDALEYARRTIELGEDPHEIAEMRLLRLEVAIHGWRREIAGTELDGLASARLSEAQRRRRELHAATHFRFEGRRAEARAILERELASADLTHDERAGLIVEFAELTVLEGKYDETQALVALWDAEGHRSERHAWIVEIMRCTLARLRGDFDRMLELSESIAIRARERGDVSMEAAAYFNVAVAQQNRGAFDEAQAATDLAEAAYRRCDARRGQRNLEVNRAALAASRADYAGAIALCRELDRDTASERFSFVTINVLNWANAELCLGNEQRARGLLTRVEPLPDDTSETAGYWWYLDGLAKWSALEPSRALASLERGLAIYRGLGSPGMSALIEGLGALARLDLGDADGALERARHAAACPESRLRESDFPHVASWALAATARDAEKTEARAAAERIWRQRADALGNEERRRAYGRVWWNARFLRDLALEAGNAHRTQHR